MGYIDFLKNKETIDPFTGSEPVIHNDILFDFQSDIVNWAVRRGRAAVFADCGLGKTLMQLSWAQNVCKITGGDVLILAPLAVSKQTANEARKMLGIDIKICASSLEVEPGINITNYEKLHNFDTSVFSGVVLDESSIIKHHTSKTRDILLQSFASTPYRLACTATPSPNDYMELGNHSEFIGSMTRSEMLAMFFVHDGGDTAKWRLKGHAEDEFWKWLCTWSVMIRKPSDLGYNDDAFKLPPVHVHNDVVNLGKPLNGMLFAMPAKTMQERRQARKESLVDRCKIAADLVNNSTESWVVWCDLNIESEMLNRLITDAIEVKGSHDAQYKENAMNGFTSGKHRAIVSKPSISGFGMNWQHCHNMAFVGLSDSFEAYYQATRRCWRFGQKNQVNVHVITSDMEGNIVQNIERKERDAMFMAENMVEHMKESMNKEIKGSERSIANYLPIEQTILPSFLGES